MLVSLYHHNYCNPFLADTAEREVLEETGIIASKSIEEVIDRL